MSSPANLTAPDQYFLGYRSAEQQRLKRQAAELAEDSAWLFDQLGSLAGARVVELGCGPHGCLDALAGRVGPSGCVTGVERSEDAVALARELIARRELSNVEAVCGDARETSLARGSFDLVCARLVLVNVPFPEEIVAEAVALARPGGLIAFHEAAWPVHTLDPPCAAWARLYELFQAYGHANAIDLFVGRCLPRLLREHGVIDVQARPIIHGYPVGHARRMLGLQFVENLSDRLLAQELLSEDELAELTGQLKAHLEDPNTFVTSCLFMQAWGHTAS